MNNNTIKYGRRNLLLSYIILCSIGLSTFYIQSGLSTLRKEMRHVGDIPKIKITDQNQFNTMCMQFTEQWGGKYFAFYILQPNSTFKTYKEKAIVSGEITDQLPNRSPITTTKINSILGDGGFARVSPSALTDILPGNQLSDSYITVVIPISQNNVVIGELYIMFDGVGFREGNEVRATEAQLLTQLLY